MADETTPPPRTLVIDVGGTGTKMLVVDAEARPLTPRDREKTPHPATPSALLGLLGPMIARQPAFDRVSVGFPGVVRHGVVFTAPNLDDAAWSGTDLAGALEALTDKPARVANDAELQGFGVIAGEGVELVLTLGTGMGAALYTDGRLVPNLELGHHPFEKGQTYEERLGEAALRRAGKAKWSRRVHRALSLLARIFNYDRLYLGGGNTKKLRGELPPHVDRFTNEEGLRGGVQLWE